MGVNGLGAEICKNIVLCGVKSLMLLDDQVVTTQDFTGQFLIPRSDIGKNVSITSFLLYDISCIRALRQVMSMGKKYFWS